MDSKLPLGKIVVLADLAGAVKIRRKALDLTQANLGGMAQTGNRFIVELEKISDVMRPGECDAR